MKRCKQCNTDKSVDDFAWKIKAKGTRQSYCKECQKKKSRAHYQANRANYYARNDRHREEMREYIKQIKEITPCADCGKNYPARAMDFHHRNKKRELISQYSFFGTLACLKKEIDGCDILCAVCHRLRH